MEPYEERLLAEHQQVTERIDKLGAMIVKWDKDELDFEPECTKTELLAQYYAMAAYQYAIENRTDFRRLTKEEN